MNSQKIKLRFCPSPTGLMHLGNTRTALFNGLYARHTGGVFLLRIEDTDQTRSHEEYTEQLKEDLQWLDLSWQEGPDVGGDNGPYWQSQRQGIYDKFYDQLMDSGLAYSCFCTEQQLALTRKLQRSSGQPPRYPGTCRHLSQSEVEEKISKGLKPTLRFKVPKDKTVSFNDLVKGQQQFACNDLGDLIIRRADGTAPFMYCNAIDDALMGVTHVLRGEDHLTNTPRQILILEALGLMVPTYCHLPLIVGDDGSPFSKRHGSRSVKDLREVGFLPLAITNYLSRLGHYYADTQFMSLTGLAELFAIDNIGTAPARFDVEQLHHWQREALQHIDENQLYQWLDTVLQQVPEEKRKLFAETIKPNILFPKDAMSWKEMLFEKLPECNDEQVLLVKNAGCDFYQTAIKGVEQLGTDYKGLCQFLKDQLQVKGKSLFQPLRVALTGMLHGPEMGNIFQLLGQEELIKRLNDGLSIAKGESIC